MSTNWYVHRNGNRMGPYSSAELQEFADEGRLTARDLVWCDGMSDWVEARTVLKPSHMRASVRPPADDRFDEEPVRHETGTRSEFPGRLITTGFFLFALLTYFLPWVDVHGGFLSLNYQSGLQTAFGGLSDSSSLLDLFGVRRFRLDREAVRAAPMMAAFGGLLLVGIVLGLAVPAGWWRMGLAGGCAVAASVLLMAQVGMGFPINEVVAVANADPNIRQVFRDPIQLFNGDVLRVSTTPWLWLSAMLTLGALGGLVIEHAAVFTWNKRNRD